VTDEAQLARRLQALMDGYLTTQVLYAASALGVLDALATRPQTAADVAGAVGVAEGPLRRILRGLVIEEVSVERADGTFELTEVGVALARLPGPLQVRATLYYRAAGGLLDAVRTGGTAFETVYGQPFFRYLDTESEAQAAFEASMAGRAVAEARDVVAAYDFRPYRTIVDVGGGRGILLSAILHAVPHATGVLLDRPDVVAQARKHLGAAGLDDRVRLVTGDFFDEVPAGGDAYLLARILHDWDDDAAVAILDRCRTAMAPESHLLVVDALLPERADPSTPGAIRMDLHMLELFGSAERTGNQLTALLARSGFTVQRIVETHSPAGIGIVEATPR
jgi:predicted O-methyltransferase YrrM